MPDNGQTDVLDLSGNGKGVALIDDLDSETIVRTLDILGKTAGYSSYLSLRSLDPLEDPVNEGYGAFFVGVVGGYPLPKFWRFGIANLVTNRILIEAPTGLGGAFDGFEFDKTPYVNGDAIYHEGNPPPAGGLVDGDYGDIVISGSGTVLSFDTGVVTAFAKTILDDANAAAVRGTIGLGTVATLASDTDTTLASNSDVKVATQKAVKAYVDAAVTGLLDFKSATDASGNPNYPAASKGDAYVVSVAGKVGGASGKSVDIGDMYLAIADNAGGTEAAVGTNWVVLEHNLAGVYVAGGTDVAIADGGTGASSVAAARANFGLDTGDSPQFAAVNIGHASDTTITRSRAGIIAVEGEELGYLGSPVNSQSAAYTTVMSDAGKTIYHPSTDASARVFTIDSNANVPYPIGTIIGFVNENGAGAVTIAITSDTLRWGSSTGSRTLAANGACAAQKMTSTVWRLTGDGLT